MLKNGYNLFRFKLNIFMLLNSIIDLSKILHAIPKNFLSKYSRVKILFCKGGNSVVSFCNFCFCPLVFFSDFRIT